MSRNSSCDDCVAHAEVTCFSLRSTEIIYGYKTFETDSHEICCRSYSVCGVAVRYQAAYPTQLVT